MVRVGRMLRKVVVQQLATSQDATGTPTETWTDLATRNAALEPLNGREFFTASGDNTEISARIRMRWDKALKPVKPHDRIVDRNISPEVAYDIQSIINPSERNRELIFMVQRDG